MDKTPPILSAMLAIRQHRLNQAVGLIRPTTQVVSLLTAYQRKKQQETSRYAQAVYLQSQLRARQRAIKELIANFEARQGTPNIIDRAKRLQTEAEVLAKLLAELDATEAAE